MATTVSMENHSLLVACSLWKTGRRLTDCSLTSLSPSSRTIPCSYTHEKTEACTHTTEGHAACHSRVQGPWCRALTRGWDKARQELTGSVLPSYLIRSGRGQIWEGHLFTCQSLEGRHFVSPAVNKYSMSLCNKYGGQWTLKKSGGSIIFPTPVHTHTQITWWLSSRKKSKLQMAGSFGNLKVLWPSRKCDNLSHWRGSSIFYSCWGHFR